MSRPPRAATSSSTVNLDALATELDTDAEEAVDHDVRRLRLLAETLRGIGGALP